MKISSLFTNKNLADLFEKVLPENYSLDFLFESTTSEESTLDLHPLRLFFAEPNLFGRLNKITLPPPSCFHLNITSEDQILVNEEYTGLSIFDKTIGKIKYKVGGIIRKEYNPTKEDLKLQEDVDAMSHYISTKMNKQDSSDIETASIVSENESERDASTPTLLDNINNTLTIIKNKLNNNIQDRRIFNGRKAEVCLCETFTDDQIVDLMQIIYKKMYGIEMRVSRVLNKFLVCFQEAFFKWIKENKKSEEKSIIGKIAHYSRIAIDTFGEYIGSGVRNFQKLIEWFNGDLIEYPENIWQYRENNKKREWQDCSSEIYGYLCVELPLIAEPD